MIKFLEFFISIINTFKGFLKWVGRSIKYFISKDIIKENEKLRAQLLKQNSMVYDKQEHVYYEHKEDGSRDGPFCPRCWQDKSKNQVYLMPFDLDLRCPVCTMVVGDKNSKRNSSEWNDFFDMWN